MEAADVSSRIQQDMQKWELQCIRWTVSVCKENLKASNEDFKSKFLLYPMSCNIYSLKDNSHPCFFFFFWWISTLVSLSHASPLHMRGIIHSIYYNSMNSNISFSLYINLFHPICVVTDIVDSLKYTTY